ncbi:adenylosuccinate synthase [Eubacteriales bacterium OttesenSCG-928-M02]|nr:adenylosuccinate synthase [Eubacteriales bacterium OttesenSCG-928-M02]
MLTAVVGINWGDEGKGRMVDQLSGEMDIVVRYQGGNNAGHTVITPQGKFILNLLPVGILREGVTNILGNGMVVDIEHLIKEIAALREGGVAISLDNLKISDRAIISMPYHRLLDGLEEDRMAGDKQGSTRRGIGPAYGDKYQRKAIRMGDLLCPEALKKEVAALVEWKNLTIVGGYGESAITTDEMMEWLTEYGTPLQDYICDTGLYLEKALDDGKRVMLEAQLGALRDIEFGIYPYTTSSNAISAYGPIGAGIPGRRVDRTIGIVKAYSSSVGGGPFTVEWFGEEAERLREAGSEYGAATGRPRRVGPFDMVASRYGVRIQGADELVLTKLDILSYMEEIPLCVAYEIDGEETREFPTGERLNRAKPVCETMKGWGVDISGCRSMGELPTEAVAYIERIERELGCPIKYISVGPKRDDTIVKE